MGPAAFLNYIVTANTAPADAALARSQAKLVATGKTATATGLTMKKAFVGIGAAAGVTVAALFKVGEEFDTAYDKITTRTGKTGKDLDKLKNDFRAVVRTVPADFDQAAEAVGGLNQRLDLTGKPLREMARQITELSRLTGTDVETNVRNVSRAFVDWEVKTKDQGKTLDSFFALSQETGISVEELSESVQKFGSPLRQLGFTLEESAAMFATFEKAGVNSQTMVPGFKLAISNLTKPADELAASMEKLGISTGKPDEALQQVFELLSSSSNLSAVEKTGLAMDVFGKRAGADMAEAIKQGRFELDDLMKVVGDSEGTLRDAGRETMDFSEHWQKFKNNVLLALEPIATDVFEGISDAMGDVVKVLQDPKMSGAQKLDAISSMVGEAIGNAAKKAAELAPTIIAGLVKGLASIGGDKALMISGAIWAAMGGKAALDALGKKMGKTMGKGIILGILLALPALFTDAADWGANNRDKILQIGSDIGEWIVNGMIDAINVGIRSINDVMDELNVLGKFGVDMPNIGEIGKVSFEGPIEQQEELAAATKRNADKIRDDWRKGWMALPGDTAKAGRMTNAEQQAWLSKFDNTTDKKTEDARDHADKNTRSMGNKVEGNVRGMVNATISGVGHLTNETSKALKAFGVKPLNYTPKALAKGATETITGGILGRNRGGPIPGSGNSDTVAAMLTPGEFVVNAKATAKARPLLEAINRRYASGGLVQALGPYDIPPIQYDPNHAGGNSHLHLSMSSVGAAQALARQIAPMGWTASEAPWAGGLSVAHSDPGHYSGSAFDANTAANETRSEVAAVARILGGAGGAGAAVAQKLARIILKGPRGPLRDMGQSALDKTRRAAQKFIDSKAPTVTGGVNTSVPVGPVQEMARAMINQIWGPGQWSPFNLLEIGEAGWNPRAYNASSGAAGLAQALPASKYPPGAWPYQGPESARLQLQWMMGYIQDNYGTPANAYSTWLSRSPHWYSKGGVVGNYAAGGDVTRSGVARVHRGERITPAGTPHVEIVLNGSMDAVLDEVDVLIDGRKAEIADYTLREGGRTRGRARQMAGR